MPVVEWKTPVHKLGSMRSCNSRLPLLKLPYSSHNFLTLNVTLFFGHDRPTVYDRLHTPVRFRVWLIEAFGNVLNCSINESKKLDSEVFLDCREKMNWSSFVQRLSRRFGWRTCNGIAISHTRSILSRWWLNLKPSVTPNTSWAAINASNVWPFSSWLRIQAARAFYTPSSTVAMVATSLTKSRMTGYDRSAASIAANLTAHLVGQSGLGETGLSNSVLLVCHGLERFDSFDPFMRCGSARSGKYCITSEASSTVCIRGSRHLRRHAPQCLIGIAVYAQMQRDIIIEMSNYGILQMFHSNFFNEFYHSTLTGSESHC